MVTRNPLGPGHGIEPWNEHAANYPWIGWERRSDAHATVKPGFVMLSFVYRTTSPWRSWTVNPADACRFKTKADALGWVRLRRERGITTGACRLDDAVRMAAEATAQNRAARKAEG